MNKNDRDGGYGKPPKGTQFRKGRSGNPKGRPRGSRNSTSLLDEALKERVIISENGRRRRITKLEAILKQLVNKAARGDHRATQLLLAHQIPEIEKHEAEEHQGTSPAIIDLFQSAFRTLMALGATFPGYQVIPTNEEKREIEIIASEIAVENRSLEQSTGSKTTES